MMNIVVQVICEH